MEMRKFIIEIHSDGSLTCIEYEDPSDAIRAANDIAWKKGYQKALDCCNDQVEALDGLRGLNTWANLMYQGAVRVRDAVAAMNT